MKIAISTPELINMFIDSLCERNDINTSEYEVIVEPKDIMCNCQPAWGTYAPHTILDCPQRRGIYF